MEVFENWSEQGVGLVEDVNFPRAHSNHPWRAGWRELVGRAGLETNRNDIESYPSGGFVTVKRRDAGLLRTWTDLTLAYEAAGGSTASYRMAERWKEIVSDQDLLAVAMMAWGGPLSILGPEAMGFTQYFFIPSRPLESPKPWAKSYFLKALGGDRPTKGGSYFLKYASGGPIQSFSNRVLFLRKLDFLLGKAVARVWKRALDEKRC